MRVKDIERENNARASGGNGSGSASGAGRGGTPGSVESTPRRSGSDQRSVFTTDQVHPPVTVNICVDGDVLGGVDELAAMLSRPIEAQLRRIWARSR